MKKLNEKLKSNKGETLVEVLVSILIVALVTAMLAYAITTAAQINKKVENVDKIYTDGVNAVSVRTELNTSGKITIQGSNAQNIKFYGDENLVTFELQ